MSTPPSNAFRKLKTDKAIIELRLDIDKLSFAVAVARNNIKALKKKLKKLKAKK